MTIVHLAVAIAAPWSDIAPIRVGDAFRTWGTPDLFVIVERQGVPAGRIDVYGDAGRESLFAADAQAWDRQVVIGFGQQVFVVDIDNRQAATIELGSYFSGFELGDDVLLIISGERILCLGPEGHLRWKSDLLGIDGVLVERVANSAIEGRGEWDPPGGWRPFRLDAATGGAF